MDSIHLPEQEKIDVEYQAQPNIYNLSEVFESPAGRG